MPTLPLYVPPQGNADAWHQVTAPGGYEAWRFDVEDERAGIHLVASFCEGETARTDYLSRYRRYLRHPTRNLPPVPAEYPSVHVAVYRHGQLISTFGARFGPDEFVASSERPDVRIGRNSMSVDRDGAYHLHVEDGPQSGSRASQGEPFRAALTADLVLKPTFGHAPLDLPMFSPQSGFGEHRWIVAAPHCAVKGSIRIEAAGSAPQEFALDGRGYHDHIYGTRPLDSHLWQWLTGRAIFDDRTLAFSRAASGDPSAPVGAYLVVADAAGITSTASATMAATWDPDDQLRIMPEELVVGGRLRLTSLKLMSSESAHWRVVYHAEETGRDSSVPCRCTILWTGGGR